MASMAELARQLLGMNGNSVGGVSPDRYMEIMDRSPYGTGVPLEIGYGEQDQMSPLDAAAIVTGGVPVVGDLTGLAADVDMYMRDPESRNIPNYLLTAAGALPFLPAASQVRQGIKAYHGSPHSFDRFSTEQIGTGEGAQAYGQGLYFAGNEKVAEGYKGTTNYADKKRQFLKELPEDADAEELMQLAKEGVFSDDLNELLMALEADDWLGFDYPSQAISASLSGNLKNYDASPRLIKATKSGSMYEVNIDVEPDELLDWDLPLSEQSEMVRNALGGYSSVDTDRVMERVLNSDGSDGFSIISDEGGIYAQADNKMFNDAGEFQSIDEAKSWLLPKIREYTGDNPQGSKIYRNLTETNGDQALGQNIATDILQAQGIKGIRYADAFTRHKTPDKRSMNYVIFDDRLITIAKKYGIAIPAAAAMLARMTGEDTSQSYQEAI
jgi:hypothetical protein